MATTDKPEKTSTTPRVQARYQPRPELGEIYADEIRNVLLDGSSFRAELCVRRLDGGPAREVVVPVGRLIFTPRAAADLHRRLENLMGELTRRGVLRKATAKPKA